MSEDRAEDDSAITREIKLEVGQSEISQRAGVTHESAAIVEAEVRNGELYVTVAGQKNPHETAHRLPDELYIRRCTDCGHEYQSSVRQCPDCGSEETEFDIHG